MLQAREWKEHDGLSGHLGEGYDEALCPPFHDTFPARFLNQVVDFLGVVGSYKEVEVLLSFRIQLLLSQSQYPLISHIYWSFNTD